MPVHLLAFTYTDSTPTRLDDFLLRILPRELERLGGTSPAPVSKAKLRRLIISGAIRVNGRQARNANWALGSGSRVAVRFDPEKFAFEKRPDDIPFDLSPDRVLYEDEWLIVVDKPSGIPTEATMVQSRDHLHAAVVRFLALRDDPGGESADGPYVGLHHRLDRETSGVILFTKRRDANAAVHKMFQDHAIRKEYQALTVRPQGPIKSAFSVDNQLARVSPKSAAAKWGAVKEGLPAHTDFRVLEERTRGLHVLAAPRTGRTHQIRVHLAGVGMPLLGDTLYGGPVGPEAARYGRAMLHAASLSFPHPISGKKISVTAPLPRDFLDCLDGL